MADPTRTEQDDRLAVYLNDHLAGSAAAIRMLERHVDREPDSEFGMVMSDLLGEIRQDRAALERVMERIGASSSPGKHAGALGAELLTTFRNKLPVLGAGSEDVARLEELELLSLGIEGKRLLWRALETCASANPKLTGVDFADLAERAESQRERLEPFRLRRAAAAFVPSP